MKNSNNSGPSNKCPVVVTIDEIPLLKNIVEKLAHRRYEIGFSLQPVPNGWVAVDPSSVEAYVSGSIELANDNEPISLAYTTCFAFTCLKTARGMNKLCWINSLS